MNTFELQLYSTTQREDIHNVVSFTGEDASGKFGILAHHARMMTCLNYGLATIRYDNHDQEYLALPGGVLYVNNNQLVISTRHYLRSNDYQAMPSAIDDASRIEENSASNIKNSLQRLDEELLRHLLTLKKQGHYEA